MSAMTLAISKCQDLGISEDDMDNILNNVRICCEEEWCITSTYTGIEVAWAKRRGQKAKAEGTATHECPYYGEDDSLLKAWFEGYFDKDWESILTDQYSGEHALSKDQINDELPDKFFDEMSYSTSYNSATPYNYTWEPAQGTDNVLSFLNDEFKDGE